MPADTDVHKKNRKKNIALLAVLVAFIAIIWVLTMVKIANAETLTERIGGAVFGQQDARKSGYSRDPFAMGAQNQNDRTAPSSSQTLSAPIMQDFEPIRDDVRPIRTRETDYSAARPAADLDSYRNEIRSERQGSISSPTVPAAPLRPAAPSRPELPAIRTETTLPFSSPALESLDRQKRDPYAMEEPFLQDAQIPNFMIERDQDNETQAQSYNQPESIDTMPGAAMPARQMATQNNQDGDRRQTSAAFSRRNQGNVILSPETN